MKFFFIFTVLCCLINIYLWCSYKRLWMCSSMYWSNIIFYTLNEKIWTIVCHFSIFNLTVRQIVHKIRVGCWFSVYCWRLTMTCTINKPTEVSMITFKLCGFCCCFFGFLVFFLQYDNVFLIEYNRYTWQFCHV